MLNIYAFSTYQILYNSCWEKNENKQKEALFGPFSKSEMSLFQDLNSHHSKNVHRLVLPAAKFVLSKSAQKILERDE